MIRTVFLVIFAVCSACSLVHRDLPNEGPVVEMARFVCIGADGQRDTLSIEETCQIRRGGEVELSTFASDEDDDPLFYRWSSIGGGSFRDSLAAQTSWFAPENLDGDTETFLLLASISDRDCDAVQLEEDRQRCLSDASTQTLSFTVTVIQRPPTIEASADTAVSFGDQQIIVEAFASDPDGDVLTYEWTQLDDHPAIDIVQQPINEEGQRVGSRAAFTPLLPGLYNLRVSASDGMAVAQRDIALTVIPETDLPSDGMQTLSLSTEDGSLHTYEIDVYEYPNRRGELPVLATWFDAAVLCAAEGKRLCDPAEWKNACAGEQLRSYSSTDDPSATGALTNFGLRFCNTDRSYHSELEYPIAASGSYPNCHADNSIYDLTGNLREWTGSIDAFGDWSMRSSYSHLGDDEPSAGQTCESLELFDLPSLQGTSFDFSDAESVQQFVSQLSEVERQRIAQPLTGFRCCR